MSSDVPPMVKVADFGLAKMVNSYTMLRVCDPLFFDARNLIVNVDYVRYAKLFGP